MIKLLNTKLEAWYRVFSERTQRIAITNEIRQPLFRDHIASGGRIDLEFGCGDGEFAHSLSAVSKRWVVGIDSCAAPMSDEGRFSISDYERSNRFLYLSGNYISFLYQWQNNSWLEASAERTFMIGPFTERSFCEEVELFKRISAPTGELHIKTAEPKVITKIQMQLDFSYEVIEFPDEAQGLLSSHIYEALERGMPLYTFSLKRTV